MNRSGPPKRRTPLKRGGGPARSGRLRPVSAKRRRENVERRRVLHDTYGPNPACWACPILAGAGIATGCDGRADDGHELLRRSKGGSIVDLENVRPVGRACHRWITEHPTEARRLGLEHG